MGRNKKHKKYFPRCCGVPMLSIWEHTGKTGRTGNPKGFLSHMECKKCGRKMPVR